MNKIVWRGKIDGKDIIIRYPKISDAKTARNFINKISKEKSFLMIQGKQLSLKEEKKLLKKWIKDIKRKSMIKLMALHKNEIIGSTDIHLNSGAQKHIGGLGAAVAKDFRGKGLGKLLMKLLLQESRENLKELKIITLEVFAINKIAKNLYKKFGFKEYGRLPRGLFRRNKYTDGILMYKKIR
ncbi:MAG: GNAT family N-acetyltransferase [Candidatus Colwellbacteria bacterium]|nr:GNAT family N-acetyltransferase [Candidatus Colwellbacteria bacterium]